MTTVGQYHLITEFTTAGGGQCRWAFAKKGSSEYFLKEFLSPTFPLPEAPGSPTTKARKLERCKEFESRHRAMIKSLEGVSSHGGNLVVARHFFRHGARYYKVTDKVDVSSLSIGEVHTLPPSQRIILAMTVAHSLQILHRLDLVHGDIKPPNVLLKETRKGYFAAKLIDFDDAYFSQRPAPPTELVGDTVYYAPETHRYIQGEGDPDNLQCAADIFALGILFTEYFTGSRPTYAESETSAVGVLDGKVCMTGLETAWPAMHSLISNMMQLEYVKRPSVTEVISSLRSIKGGGDGSSSAPKAPVDVGPRMRGRLLDTDTKAPPTSASGSTKESSSRLRGSLLSSAADEPSVEEVPRTSRLSGSLVRKKAPGSE